MIISNTGRNQKYRKKEEQKLCNQREGLRGTLPPVLASLKRKMENTKRDLSLDFTKPCHFRNNGQQTSLVTPILALSTPEVQRMISGDELAVLTPNGISSVIPQSTVIASPLIPTTVNSSNNNNINNNNINNNNNNNSNNNGNYNHTVIQKRSDKPPGDLDVEKIEKKRERNRLAAKKCRQRKLETIDGLRKIVSEWEQKYEKLESDFERFKSQRNKEIERLSVENSELKSLLRQ